MVSVPRMRESIERHGERFLRRVFTEREVSYCASRARRHEHYGGRFAAKEAVLKALGTGAARNARFVEIEVVRDARGRPKIVLHGATQALAREKGVDVVHISIAHTQEFAIAHAVLERTA